MKEIWKNIKDFEGLYQVSNLGRVRSLDRAYIGRNQYGAEFTIVSKGSILKDRPKNKYSKYRRIGLRKEGKKYYFFVHRLVYEAFNGRIPPGMQINHIDENPENNRLENLNLMTPKENSNYGSHNQKIREAQTGSKNSFYGKHPSDYCKQRTKEVHNKPVAKYTKSFVFIEQYESVKDASVKNNVPGPNISNVCNHRGYCKTAGGYIWRFV